MGGVQENAIYPIDGLPIFEKPDFVVRKFPDSWSAPQPQRVRSIAEHRPPYLLRALCRCIDSIDPIRADGICEYMKLNRWYALKTHLLNPPTE